MVVAIFAFLNRDYVLNRRLAQQKGEFYLCAGEEEFTISVNDILSLSPFSITANYKITGRGAASRIYQGVSFKAVVESLGIAYTEYQTVSFIGADGYFSALRMAEAMDENNCYLVIAMDNEPLGTRENGGEGPIMMIMARDRFSQRWCKYLVEVTLR